MQAKRRRRKTAKGMATNELAEGSGDAQHRCDAEETTSEEREKAVEDEMVVFSQPSQPSVSAGHRLSGMLLVT